MNDKEKIESIFAKVHDVLDISHNEVSGLVDLAWSHLDTFVDTWKTNAMAEVDKREQRSGAVRIEDIIDMINKNKDV